MKQKELFACFLQCTAVTFLPPPPPPPQVVFHRMQLVSKLAEQLKWQVIQQLPHPLLSPALARLQEKYAESTSLRLESSDCQHTLELLFHWNQLSVCTGSLKATPPGVGGAADRVEGKWESRSVVMQDIPGASVREKFTNLFSNQYQ